MWSLQEGPLLGILAEVLFVCLTCDSKCLGHSVGHMRLKLACLLQPTDGSSGQQQGSSAA
eukprot:scaffold186605_cov16-Tisochrysis_lutea.AAC.3